MDEQMDGTNRWTDDDDDDDDDVMWCVTCTACYVYMPHVCMAILLRLGLGLGLGLSKLTTSYRIRLRT